MHPADRHYRGFPDFSTWSQSRVASDLWDRSVQLLADRRALAGPAAFATHAERAARMASIDTGAIEGLYPVDRGFTMTVAAMASEWGAQIQRSKGSDVAALVAAQRAGYDMALDAATHETAMSEVWIRQLHEVVCDAQDTYSVETAVGPQRHPLGKGRYKESPNHVELADGSVHEYAPVEDTPADMHRLVTELRSVPFAQANPVLQASFAHYAFVCIHPFADGNGRVARALASVYTFRATSLPFVIFADQKADYFAALREADDSRFQAFVDFTLFRTLDLLQLLAEQLREAAGTSIEDAGRRLSELPSYPEVRLLREYVGSAAESQLAALDLPSSVVRDVRITSEPEEFGHHGDPVLRIFLRTFSPGTASVEEFLTVSPGVQQAGQPPEFVVGRLGRPGDTIEVRRDEVLPVMKATLDARIAAWVRRVLAELLAELAAQAERS